MRLLIIEDDRALANNIKNALHKAGYVVDIENNGIDGEFMGNENLFELIILDLGLPKKPGLEVLKAWRNNGNKTPVLILTARSDWSERVDGLQAGADDYLCKPFHIEELMARVSALIRRSYGEASPKLCQGGIELDEQQKIATLNHQQYPLTHVEFRLLHYFMTHPNVVLSKNRLIDHIYEGDVEKDGNIIEVYIRRLRNKLGKDTIKTKRYQGYVFVGVNPNIAR